MKRYLSVLVLGAAMIGSAALSAQDKDRDRDQHNNGLHKGQRYYDKNGKDWHDWNDNETRAYQKYLQEHRKKEHDFAKAKSRERDDYYKWRHDHPDSSERH
jgi:Ni/Co efflux regulator RcnB